MSICPFAVVRLLPESHTQPTIAPRIAILHSAAGRGSLYGYFLNSSPLESHFWVSESGVIEQYVDTNRRADANRNANGYAVSIETESSLAATERWSPAQAAAIVRLLDWLCTEHPNIRRRQCDAPDGSGIGWHIMFGTPGPWTPVRKSCPGPARIAQARDEIIPAVARLGDTTPGGFHMDAEAKAAFAALDAKLAVIEAKADRIIASERTNSARQLESVRGVRKILTKFGLAKPKG